MEVGRGGKGGGGGGDGAKAGTERSEPSDTEETTTWARVVRGPKGKRCAVREGRGVGDDGEEGGSDQNMGEEECESEEGLPPLRVFDPPAEPREAILRRAEAAAAKAKRAKERGVAGEKIQRAEAEADGLAKRLREAGGPTPTALLFQIRGEEKKKLSAVRAIEALQKKIAEEEDEVLRRRMGIQKLHRMVERHQGRLEVSEKRLLYLAGQKHSESLPLAGVAQLRTAASLLAATGQQAFSPILELLATLIPSESHDMEEGDTSGDSGDGGADEEGGNTTEEEMDEDGPSKYVDWSKYEGDYAGQLQEASGDLKRAKRAMLEAVEAAREGQRKPNKRPIGGDGPKVEDEAGDVDMVPTLTPAQVEEIHRGRIKEAAGRYRHLQTLAAREMEAGSGGGQQQQRQQPRPPPEVGPTPPSAPSQPREQGAKGGKGSQGTGAGSAAEGRETELQGGDARPRAHCVAQYQTAEERDGDRGRWRAGAGRARGRSWEPRREGGHERQSEAREAEVRHRGRDPAPVTPVDPHGARMVEGEICEARRSIAARMDQVRLQVETHDAAECIKEAVSINNEIRAQERMQLVQEAEFAAVVSKRASDAGLQTEQQREELRRLWIAELAKRGEVQIAEAAFAMHGPTGTPLEEQQRALRAATRTANLGEAAGSGCGGGVEMAAKGGAPGGPPQRARSTGGSAEGGRSRSKSPRPRGGARARREGGWD